LKHFHKRDIVQGWKEALNRFGILWKPVSHSKGYAVWRDVDLQPEPLCDLLLEVIRGV
jgi:hypothetical protein